MKNWKTTTIGLLAAIWLMVQPILINNNFILQRDWRQLVYAAIAAAFGFFAKDHNVTGGTTVNTPNDAATVKEATQINQ